jgi:hypothetical protein
MPVLYPPLFRNSAKVISVRGRPNKDDGPEIEYEVILLNLEVVLLILLVWNRW